MKNSLKYLKKILKVLIWPIIFIIGSFFINYIFVAIFNSKINLNNSELLEYVKTIEYKDRLNSYINANSVIIAIITAIIFIPLFLKIFKKYKQENNFNIH